MVRWLDFQTKKEHCSTDQRSRSDLIRSREEAEGGEWREENEREGREREEIEREGRARGSGPRTGNKEVMSGDLKNGC